MSTRGSYRNVKQHVLGQIHSGVWRPGALIPKEQELADTFGCARMTVHRALRELAEEGVVERRRRLGTRVALQTERSAFIEIPRVDQEIEATGASYRYARIARRVARPNATSAAHLNMPTDQKALRVECLHYANDVPFQLEERWINLAVVPEAGGESFLERSPNAWLLEHRPWSDVEHVISAVGATARAARHLEIKAGDPLLVVERRTWSDEQVITSARMLHPGRFYRIRAGGRTTPGGRTSPTRG